MARDDRASVKAARIGAGGAVIAALVGGVFLLVSVLIGSRSTHKPEPAVVDNGSNQQADQPTVEGPPGVLPGG